MAVLTLISIITIMSIMIFSSFFNSSAPNDGYKFLLDTVGGYVGAGNYSYWQLGHEGPLEIELRSLSGDADIYVADKPRPSFEINGNNMSSATCGVDIVKVPKDFPRPIGIGVFGHWSHAISEYMLYVYLDNEHQELEYESADSFLDSANKEKKYITDKNHKEKDTNKESFFEKCFFHMIGVLFELFVL